MFKYIIFSSALTALLSANILNWRDPFLGVFLTLAYLLYFGRRLGGLAMPDLNHFWQRLFGPLFLLAGLSAAGAAVYFFYALPEWIVIALLAIFPAGLIPYCRFFKKKIDEWPEGHLEAVPLIEPNTRPANRWAWLVLLLDAYLFYYLFSHATDAAIRSPWSLFAYKFFVIFFIATFFLILFIRRTESGMLSFFAIFAHSFLLLSVALIVYRLGYGFDPTIHRAAEDYISSFGELFPKTPYYLGQYALVVILSKITALPPGWIDKILLPLLEAAILPPLIFLTLRHGLNWERKAARLGSILFFLIPFSSFIATTPQDLANFFALTLLLFGALFLTGRLIPWWAPLVLALAALAAHPLTGLLMLGFYLFLLVLGLTAGKRHREGPPMKSWAAKQSRFSFFTRLLRPRFYRWLAMTIIFLFSLFALPLSFLLFAKAQPHLPSWEQISGLFSALAPPAKRPDQPFSPAFFLIYHYQYLLSFLVLAASAFGGYRLFKNKIYRPLVYLSLISFLFFILNAVWLKFFFTFAGVGGFEQGQYAERLYRFSFYLLLPLFLCGLLHLVKKFFAALWLCGSTALLLAVSFYLSYPRVDAYAFSRYINTSAGDIKTVRQIEKKAGGQDYIVLGNASFSAAAVREFGFKKYFPTPTGKLFYYALPTGSPLYSYFEKMAYQGAARDTMLEAMDLTGAEQGFFVLHDYWNSFKTAAPPAKQTADEWWEVYAGPGLTQDGAQGKILVFRYKK